MNLALNLMMSEVTSQQLKAKLKRQEFEKKQRELKRNQKDKTKGAKKMYYWRCPKCKIVNPRSFYCRECDRRADKISNRVM